ncbi:MAG: DUF6394 family protein [Propionibacteriaceae bacterium]|jgi:hypothetical protein|nr:DUF6394 family protein [Propionibacteriaceae bacterium]
MNFEKVVFGFFITLALTLNFGFFTGDMEIVDHHNGVELIAATVVSLIATVLKFGDRTQLGAVHLATSLVADLQLIVACVLWVWFGEVNSGGLDGSHMALIVSMSAGALVANAVSVVLMISEVMQFRR